MIQCLYVLSSQIMDRGPSFMTRGCKVHLLWYVLFFILHYLFCIWYSPIVIHSKIQYLIFSTCYPFQNPENIFFITQSHKHTSKQTNKQTIKQTNSQSNKQLGCNYYCASLSSSTQALEEFGESTPPNSVALRSRQRWWNSNREFEI